MDDTKELTPKQQRFIREFQLNAWTDATTAYRKAFKTPSTTSIPTSRANANKLLSRSHIKEYIKEVKEISQKRSHITFDKIIERMDENAKSSKDKGDYKSEASSLMNVAKLLGYGDGQRNTFSIRECKTLDDIHAELQRALDAYSAAYLSEKEMQVIQNNLEAQKKTIIDAELIKQVKTLEEIQEALGK